MKKEFKLEKVLEFRIKELDKEKAKLRELTAQDNMMVQQMYEIIEEIKSKRVEQENEVSEGNFNFTELYNKYISTRENDLEFIRKKRDEILKLIEKQKEVMKKALSNVKIMEKLKEKHLLEYAKYMSKLEELQIDEINITKAKNIESF